MHVHKIDDIASLLRLQEELGIRVTVDHACDVNDGHIYSVLKDRGIPVVFGPLDAFCLQGRAEARELAQRAPPPGERRGFRSHDGPSRDPPAQPLPRAALVNADAGLNRQDAIEIVTRRNAQLLGVSSFLGTLDKGKWASFSCWNGDPSTSADTPWWCTARVRWCCWRLTRRLADRVLPHGREAYLMRQEDAHLKGLGRRWLAVPAVVLASA